jgi:hypothetical protein
MSTTGFDPLCIGRLEAVVSVQVVHIFLEQMVVLDDLMGLLIARALSGHKAGLIESDLIEEFFLRHMS